MSTPGLWYLFHLDLSAVEDEDVGRQPVSPSLPRWLKPWIDWLTPFLERVLDWLLTSSALRLAKAVVAAGIALLLMPWWAPFAERASEVILKQKVTFTTEPWIGFLLICAGLLYHLVFVYLDRARSAQSIIFQRLFDQSKESLLEYLRDVDLWLLNIESKRGSLGKLFPIHYGNVDLPIWTDRKHIGRHEYLDAMEALRRQEQEMSKLSGRYNDYHSVRDGTILVDELIAGVSNKGLGIEESPEQIEQQEWFRKKVENFKEELNKRYAHQSMQTLPTDPLFQKDLADLEAEVRRAATKLRLGERRLRELTRKYELLVDDADQES